MKLGRLLMEQGDLSQSEQHFELALKQVANVRGPHTLYIVAPARQLASLYQQTGHFESAEGILGRCYDLLHLHRQKPATNPVDAEKVGQHLATDDILSGVCEQLASVLSDHGRHAQALQLAQQAFDLVEGKSQPSSRPSNQISEAMTAIAEALGMAAPDAKALEQARALARLSLISSDWYSLNELDKATECARAAHKLASTEYLAGVPASDAHRCASLFNLGRIYQQQRDFAKATNSLQRALRIARHSCSHSHSLAIEQALEEIRREQQPSSSSTKRD